ncbi:MAG: hypothetical protein ACTHJT_05615, partial [Cytophaga sp.]|uniref:hypothetical protein n=1 Tax=Cytophaga sp. TaxID=29535 RepID=UPI003F80726E
KNGIYTSAIELRYNSPKYPDCSLELNSLTDKVPTTNLYYVSSQDIKHKFEDNIFAMVREGILYIFYHNYFSPVFQRGSICTFILKEVQTTTYYPSGSSVGTAGTTMHSGVPVTTSHTTMNIYFMDFQSGIIEKVKKENLDPIIKRDAVLYERFKKIKGDPKNKKSYPYISQYNARNPYYIILVREVTENTGQ